MSTDPNKDPIQDPDEELTSLEADLEDEQIGTGEESNQDGLVDKDGLESFPASDPPGHY